MLNREIVDRLTQLATAERTAVGEWLAERDAQARIVLLIEAARVMDMLCIRRLMAATDDERSSLPDFDITSYGWNPALGFLLAGESPLLAVPLMTSTNETRGIASTLLHQLGRASLATKGADMLKHGMADGEQVDDAIVIRMRERGVTDHFSDRLEPDLLDKAERDRDVPWRSPTPVLHLENRYERMSSLVFPWRTSRGVMIGYGAEPDIDEYYFELVEKRVAHWRDEAGIHPDARIGEVYGADLIGIGGLLVSFTLKHVDFVGLGCRKIPEANYAMSLTIWKNRTELMDGLSDFTGISKQTVSKVIDLFTGRRSDHLYFSAQGTPFIPFFVELTPDHLLSPVSAMFRNPFIGVLLREEARLSRVGDGVRMPRENWMISDLRHLFLGTRYMVIDTPCRLKNNGRDVTDIDAAILDRLTGTLALFQLKWQDFGSGSVKVQRSRAKNFVERVDAWAIAVDTWLRQHGNERLGEALRIQRQHARAITGIRLFALGRTAARFRSYGYTQEHEGVAVCTWPRFVRARLEIGPVENVLASLHDTVRLGNVDTATRPIPHEIVLGGQRIVFEDLWQSYDDGDD
jgi:hypothetical protein